MPDHFKISKEDMEGGFKTAPGGTYKARITNKSKIKPSKKGGGNNLEVHAVITKGPHKGISFFDTIAPHVGWKLAQIISAVGLKMKSGTLQKLLKKIVNQDVRVILREEEFEGRRKNKVVQWLPVHQEEPDLDDLDDEDEDEEDLDEEEWEDEDEDDEDVEDDEEDDEDDEYDDEDDDEDEEELEEDEEDEDIDEEEEIEEEVQKKKAPKKKKKKKK